ncbi:hypothetical protein HDF10_002803 [Edaphobacter lichenicola]|uniref:Uncharacterized protein n=1 Tax=Tunturiibacter lichenicola TaxID=2051959 RepID=A0A7W8JBC0_9BACT|nr:hypothetical protein [Edaphobacter lichenicola]
MTTAKGNRLALADQAGRDPFYCLFSGGMRRREMKINTQAKQKTPFYGCINPGF